MAIPATYTRKRDICIPGQIADTSLYNIDGTCAAANDILTGVLVALSGGVVDGQQPRERAVDQRHDEQKRDYAQDGISFCVLFWIH